MPHLRDIPELRLCSWWHLQAQQHRGQPRPCTASGRGSVRTGLLIIQVIQVKWSCSAVPCATLLPAVYHHMVQETCTVRALSLYCHQTLSAQCKPALCKRQKGVSPVFR